MSKRTRWKITAAEQAVLEETRKRTDKPTREDISSLAVLLGTTERRVRVWFQNKRQRCDARVASLPDPLVVLAAMHAHAGMPGCTPEQSVELADAVVRAWPHAAETLARTAVALQVQVEAARLLPSESLDAAFAVASGAVVQRIARCYE